MCNLKAPNEFIRQLSCRSAHRRGQIQRQSQPARWRKRPWKNWSRSGPSAIDPIVDALATAEKKETMAYVEVLSRLIDSKTLPQSAEDHV